MAADMETYVKDMADATRSLAIELVSPQIRTPYTTDDYNTAVQTAKDDYADAEADHGGTRRNAIAGADDALALAVYGRAGVRGTDGIYTTLENQRAEAIRVYAEAEANRFADAVNAVEGFVGSTPGLDAEYQAGEAAALAVAIVEVIEDTSSNYENTPWSEYNRDLIKAFEYLHAGGDPDYPNVQGLAEAEARRRTTEADELETRETGMADEAKDLAVTRANAQSKRVLDLSQQNVDEAARRSAIDLLMAGNDEFDPTMPELPVPPSTDATTIYDGLDATDYLAWAADATYDDVMTVLDKDVSNAQYTAFVSSSVTTGPTPAERVLALQRDSEYVTDLYENILGEDYAPIDAVYATFHADLPGQYLREGIAHEELHPTPGVEQSEADPAAAVLDVRWTAPVELGNVVEDAEFDGYLAALGIGNWSDEPPIDMIAEAEANVTAGAFNVGEPEDSELISDALLVPVCFAAGTPILMADGTSKPIEEIQPGDKVLAASDKDPEGPVEAKEVVEIFHNRPDPLMELTIGEQTIRCTLKHPFYAREKGWTAASELEFGDELRTHDGGWVKLAGKETKGDVEPVYNFHVAENHTYFVGDRGSGLTILVHNQSDLEDNVAGVIRVTVVIPASKIKDKSEEGLRRLKDELERWIDWLNAPKPGSGERTIDSFIALADPPTLQRPELEGRDPAAEPPVIPPGSWIGEPKSPDFLTAVKEIGKALGQKYWLPRGKDVLFDELKGEESGAAGMAGDATRRPSRYQKVIGGFRAGRDAFNNAAKKVRFLGPLARTAERFYAGSDAVWDKVAWDARIAWDELVKIGKGTHETTAMVLKDVLDGFGMVGESIKLDVGKDMEGRDEYKLIFTIRPKSKR